MGQYGEVGYTKAVFTVRGGTVSEEDHLPAGKGEEDLIIDTFVDRMQEIHPNLDRETFHETIKGCVRNAIEAGDDEEGSEEEE